jgi:hypothetical protein
VLIIPNNIFEPEGQYIELNLGKIEVHSRLLPFNKDTQYKKLLQEDLLYDEYTINFADLSL